MAAPLASQPMVTAAIATCLLALVAVAAITFLHLAGEFWSAYDPAKAASDGEYCEANRFTDFVRQPVNAWSNLIYFFLGSWIIAVGLADRRLRQPANAMQAFPWLSIWTGLMLAGLCLGSFFFHASVTRLGQHWDMGFTYAVAWCLLASGGYRWTLHLGGQAARWRGIWLGVAVGGAALMSLFKWWINGKVALPILMLAGLALAAGAYLRMPGRFSGRYLLAGTLALLLSGLFRGLDLAKVACDPDGLLQWHALWHVCTGLAAFLFWKMLWAESAPDRTTT